MKKISLLLASALLTGCAASNPQQPTHESALAAHAYEASTASALAFDAPVSAGYELPGLDRDDREPGAFVGYQDSVTETFSIGILDNQSNDPWLDTYNRWSYTEKVGTRSR